MATVFFLLLLLFCAHWQECSPEKAGSHRRRHYLLYSANPGEGFNLRRDVHVRAATLVKELRADRDDEWVLVLPPWPHLYHWKSRSVRQSNVKWESFFHVPNLNEDVPSVEFEEYATLKEGIEVG